MEHQVGVIVQHKEVRQEGDAVTVVSGLQTLVVGEPKETATWLPGTSRRDTSHW